MVALVGALVPAPLVTRPSARHVPVLFAEEGESTSLVQITEESIQQAASISTATAGLIIGGPVLAFIFAIAGNYVSKQEGDVSFCVFEN